MSDISGFGLKINIVASVTYPTGITITQSADDADFFDTPAVSIADGAMGPNGNLMTWSKASPLLPTINVQPDGDDDNALSILLNNNFSASGKTLNKDVITMTVLFPNGTKDTYNKGVILSGMPGNSMSSAGRLKTKPFAFMFESMTKG